LGNRLADRVSPLLADIRPRLLRYFLAHSFSHQDAEDLAQKALVRVYQGMERLRSEESFLPWLFAIARNLRRTARQRQLREQGRLCGLDSAEAVPDSRPPVSDERLEAERLAALVKHLQALPPQQRQCLMLRVRHEMSYDEIAETLRLSVHTVRNHLAGARRSLRQALSTAAEEREAVT